MPNVMTRVAVAKTYKLFINGQFPRTESGRSIAVHDGSGTVIAHICHASRKDLRDAVEAARTAQPRWAGATAYNRGQVLYRMAEMIESRREEFIAALRAVPIARKKGPKSPTSAMGLAAARVEVEASIDRLVAFAGWADKFAQVLGCNNSVAGPYYNFTVPEASGIVAVVAPDQPALLGLVSLIAPPLCAGNTIVASGSDANPLPAVLLGEVAATSDVPPGVLNILTGLRDELLEPMASHREIIAISAANLPPVQARALQLGAAENLKRVRTETIADAAWLDTAAMEHPWTIEPFVEMKTIWHPSAM